VVESRLDTCMTKATKADASTAHISFISNLAPARVKARICPGPTVEAARMHLVGCRIRGFAGWRGVWCPAVSSGEVERRAMGVVEAEVVLGQWGSDTLRSKATGTNGSSNAPFEQGEGLRQTTLSGTALHSTRGVDQMSTYVRRSAWVSVGHLRPGSWYWCALCSQVKRRQR
jgi:hypothetical protein